MLIVVTGAAGFVGGAVARRLDELGLARHTRLADLTSPQPPSLDFACLRADLRDAGALAAMLDGATHVIHLAALPGGAAERDPMASRRINLIASLDLIDHLASRKVAPRLIYASSIAVIGCALPAAVDDATPPKPDTTYGAHKRMIEIALADATRRGAVVGLALRLPGIVARAGDGGGFRSAFMSGVFAALLAGEDYTLPVGPEATMWLMSAEAAAAALVHAALLPTLPPGPCALTLPALRVRMNGLVHAIAEATRGPLAERRVRYAPDPETEALFGRLPPLKTPRADLMGFVHDGDVPRLVERALRGLAR